VNSRIKLSLLLGLSLGVIGAASAETYYYNQFYLCATPQDLRIETLRLVNQARAQSRYCGSEYFSATTPVYWNDKLARTAQMHSNDMARRDYFSHHGLNNTEVGDRAYQQQYNWRGIAENIYAGAPLTAEAINGWIESPGHCKNLMNPLYNEMGVACARNPTTYYGTYHTQVFGRQK